MTITEGMIFSERYEILSRIGAGGMADVYKALDRKLNRFVAVKVLKDEFAENRSFVSKFRAEAQSAAGLIHPNIVNVYDVGNEDGLYYIVMELVEGITLKHYIEKKLRLSVKESISIAIQMAMGLECAHRAHIIHRDVKPQNIIISKDGKVKVTDFGIARAATSDTITSNVMGSVHYTSPEQARGGYSDEKSDIYSLGIVLFEMLTGRVPFDGDSTVSVAIQHIQDSVPSPRDFVNDVPISVEQIIFKCCEKSPDRRYMSMTELIADLKQSLLTPDEPFVEMIPSGGKMGATRLVTEEDIHQIKARTGSIDIDESLLNAYNKKRSVQEEEELWEQERRAEERRGEGRSERRRESSKTRQGELYEFEEEGEPAPRRKRPDRDRQEKENRPEKRNGKKRPRYEEESEEEKEWRQRRQERRRKEQEEERRRSADNDRKSKKSGKYQAEEPDEDEMDPAMQRIMRILAVVIGIVILILAVVILRRVFSGISIPGSLSENAAEAETGENEVADVAGMTFEQAKEKLTSLGFTVQSENQRSDTVPQGSVISQVPAAGSRAEKGSRITLVVSSGAGSITVPSLSGRTAAEAKVMLDNEGLVMEVSQAPDSTVAEGLVCAQDPESGSPVAAGSTVKVVISTGGGTEEGQEEAQGQISVPNIVGLSETAAKTALTATNLSWSQIKEENSDTVAAGLVIAQSVAAGSMVDPGATVDFTLSLGPALPNLTPTLPAAGTYGCNFSVTAPVSYAGGDATVVLTGKTTGTTYYSQTVQAFPVSIRLSGIVEPAGTITVSYVVRTTVQVPNADGTVTTVTNDSVKSDSTDVTFTAE